MDEFEQFVVGDRITWRADLHGRPLEPDVPDVRQKSGTVSGVIRDRNGEGPVTALIVASRGLFGVHQSVVRPDYGHRPEKLDQECP
ncbi:hypothetical protein ACFWVM_34045 [Nocardia fluminea]|uniref:hypothetical protein n=1 Tax=Nocardia fluminea TaxID=134984 RepID=UPI00364C9ABE